jgi:NAD-dependent DNA ligase|tara:strand:+ start:176 stop:325 length:150 start_codon:yes stop_codon:yes gene_type:complete
MKNKIQNKHLVFTGKMEHGDRKEMKEEAKKIGVSLPILNSISFIILVYC